MIVDLARFVQTERPYWTALEEILDWMEHSPGRKLTVEEAERFHLLYQRTAADLGRISSFAAEAGLRRHLEWLVSRAYAEIHESRGRSPLRPWRWITREFPQAFRRHFQAFQLSVALTLAGILFGGLAVKFDPEAKAVLMPFEGLQVSPAERVAREKESKGRELSGHKGTFSAELMTHNTQVALLTLALGASFGFGTIAVLFYNGVVLGAVAFDYVMGGQTIFLLGWLLPHGVIEIPAILIGGQAGLVIAYALIGWGSRISRAERLRQSMPDVVMLAVGCAVMLVWAGIVEAFVSQYHEPVIRYEWKIAFGLVEAALLTLFLWRAGRRASA
jgi:uncharacterized membrane protein SpoIIM required for sporulation